jgi:hypothetical protein
MTNFRPPDAEREVAALPSIDAFSRLDLDQEKCRSLIEQSQSMVDSVGALFGS